MKRRIIGQGNNSFTLTLPIKWIREEGLKQGDEVELEKEDSSLLIFLPKDRRFRKSEISIDLKDFDKRAIRNVLYKTYRKGYDVLNLSYLDPKQLKIIDELIRESMLGFEIVEENSERCVVQNIAEPTGEKFFAILRKIFLIIKAEHEALANDLRKGMFKNFDSVVERKKLVDTYTNVCRRLIIKYKIGGRSNSYILMMLVSRLSLNHHAYYYLYKHLKNKKIEMNKQTRDLLEKIEGLFDLYYQAFFENNVEKARKIGDLYEKLLFKDFYNALDKSKGVENIILYHLGEIIRLIQMQASLIYGLLDFKREPVH